MHKPFYLLLFVLFLGNSALAVDLSDRLGLGLSQQTGAAEVPLLTAHYYPNADYGLSLGFGIDTKDDESKLAVLAKAVKIIFREEQMNFYMGGSVAIVNSEQTTVNGVEDFSNTEVSALLGGEFFFKGLDSLGFSFETGISVISGDGGSRFRTIADNPFRAGIVFYF